MLEVTVLIAAVWVCGLQCVIIYNLGRILEQLLIQTGFSERAAEHLQRLEAQRLRLEAERLKRAA